MQTGQDDGGWYQDEANEVHVTRIDVPFLDLTWFFVKASLALAVAFSLTSWLWVMIGTGMLAVSAGLLLLLGVPTWFPPVAPPPVTQMAPPTAPAPIVIAPQPAPVVEVVVTHEEPEPEPEVPAAEPIDANRAATEAAQRAELERIRRERDR